MTRDKLNEILAEWGAGAYWYGEDTGDYGQQDPEIYDDLEPKIWDAIDPYNEDKMALLRHRYNHDPIFHAMVQAIVAHIYALTIRLEDVHDAAAVADLIIREMEERNRW